MICRSRPGVKREGSVRPRAAGNAAARIRYHPAAMPTLSLEDARKIALAAQGFYRQRPASRADLDAVRSVIRSVQLVQLDTVNVVTRAHYMPFFSRLGPYEPNLIDELAFKHREMFEYWGHAASLIPMELYPLLRHRMTAQRKAGWMRRINEEHPEYVERVLDEVRERGPLSVSDLSDPGARTGPWWGLNRGKMALEWHFNNGVLAVEGRKNFTRYYDVAERVIPRGMLDAPAASEADACRELLLIAARCHGVGTAADLADYFRLKMPRVRPVLAELVSEGTLREVTVEGWDAPAYLLPETAVPTNGASPAALISPFDSLIWDRDRTERLFGFRYRIEIYVPEKQRQYGYYVFPFLFGDRLTARVDLKADRKSGRLLARAVYLEPGRNAQEVAAALAHELKRMTGWLGLRRVVVGRRGDLADNLRRAVKGVADGR